MMLKFIFHIGTSSSHGISFMKYTIVSVSYYLNYSSYSSLIFTISYIYEKENWIEVCELVTSLQC